RRVRRPDGHPDRRPVRVSEGLDATGVTTWVGRQLGARAGGSRTALLAMIMLLAAGRVVPGGQLVVLAVQRQGHNRGRTALQAGDLLLLEGPWAALDALVGHDDVLLVDSPPLVRRQSVPLGHRSTRAILVLAAMVVLLATGLVPPVVAALLAAGAMIVLRVLTVQQAYRRISWT